MDVARREDEKDYAQRGGVSKETPHFWAETIFQELLGKWVENAAQEVFLGEITLGRKFAKEFGVFASGGEGWLRDLSDLSDLSDLTDPVELVRLGLP